jgi:hypothetical protein
MSTETICAGTHLAVRLPPPPDHIDLCPQPTAPSQARKFVGRVLIRWGREELADTAKLIVSEFVSNAIDATGGPPAIAGHVWAGLFRCKGAVVIEVWDGCPEPPNLMTVSVDEESGRGLRIVDDLAEEWGYRWTRRSGKIVWAALRAG